MLKYIEADDWLWPALKETAEVRGEEDKKVLKVMSPRFVLGKNGRGVHTLKEGKVQKD